MKDAQTGQADPTTADKLWFWMGGSLPSAFSAWVEGQIRSRWFPLRRMAPAVVTAVLWVTISLVSGRSLTYVLLGATLAISIGLAASFVFRDRLRSRALRRYRIPRAD